MRKTFTCQYPCVTLFNEMNGKGKSPYNSLGQYIRERIRQKRTEDGARWTQNELAKRAGVSSGAMSMIMRGLVTPETATLEKIADALGVTLSDLLGAQTGKPQESSPDAIAGYVARRLADLPTPFRERGIEMVAAVVDGLWQIVRGDPVNGGPSPRVILMDSETAEQVVDLCHLVLTRGLKEAMPEPEEAQTQGSLAGEDDDMGNKKDETRGQRIAEAVLDAMRKLGNEVVEKSIKTTQKMQPLEEIGTQP